MDGYRTCWSALRSVHRSKRTPPRSRRVVSGVADAPTNSAPTLMPFFSRLSVTIRDPAPRVEESSTVIARSYSDRLTSTPTLPCNWPDRDSVPEFTARPNTRSFTDSFSCCAPPPEQSARPSGVGYPPFQPDSTCRFRLSWYMSIPARRTAVAPLPMSYEKSVAPVTWPRWSSFELSRLWNHGLLRLLV